MNWIDVNERLPIQLNREEESENEWVPVTDGISRWAIAKCTYDSRKNDFVWRFWESKNSTFCPSKKYEVSQMSVCDIKFWVDIWNGILSSQDKIDAEDEN